MPFPGYRRSNSFYLQRKVLNELLSSGHYDSDPGLKIIAMYVLGKLPTPQP